MMHRDREPQVFALRSGGRILRLAADDGFAASWPRLAPHVPGARSGELTLLDTGVHADLALENGVSPGDARRLINAHLHRLHLGSDTLCAHAVVLCRPDGDGTVVLLGGHGAGKTLVAIALAERGWRPAAGDVALLDVHPAPAVRGGTSAFMARSSAVARWFPQLRLDPSDADRIDLRSRWNDATDPAGGRVLAAVLVAVDGDPSARVGLYTEDTHTAATAWLRASTHLLDRILETSPMVLRLVEDAAAARRRIALVQALAARLPLHAARGTPQRIASCIEEFTSGSVKGATW
ncbi:hypothetical protein [Streptomyces fodineus]|uniref:hypothetical protein n=1 Tax=Streptomyces fodineus TaxID=1904616 RepID=UPI001D0568E2|nr:hypothetical protein [Streptomyces fodineus]